MRFEPKRQSPLSTGLAAAGVDHVRLQYEYLVAHDLDGYLSLLDQDMTVHGPGGPEGRGRDEVEELRRRQLRGSSMACVVSDVFASGTKVAAVGRYTGDALHGRPVDAEFCAVFTLSANGLLLSEKTYYCVEPPGLDWRR
ncbi:nuclear transport factor 2 family protein [Streptomyces sp. NPDC051172]|uniref:nuclear transport factor 2 family protein n=1 Tax=Streptomyces sp. NPDC051172 TaxID=3155796 RepID=UPI003423D267